MDTSAKGINDRPPGKVASLKEKPPVNNAGSRVSSRTKGNQGSPVHVTAIGTEFYRYAMALPMR
jgi:hypothetical protein